jgi:hypothetical protein
VLKQTNLSLFPETRVLIIQEESADSFLSALRKLLPNAFLTAAADGDNERATARNLTAAAVQDRKEMPVFDLVLGDNGVTFRAPRARHLTEGIMLKDDLSRFPLLIHCFPTIGRLLFLWPHQDIDNALMRGGTQLWIFFLLGAAPICHCEFPDINHGEINIILQLILQFFGLHHRVRDKGVVEGEHESDEVSSAARLQHRQTPFLSVLESNTIRSVFLLLFNHF